MKKLVLVAGLALAASVALTPFAFAADATGPDTVGCATATVVVQSKAKTASDLAAGIADQQSEVIKGLKAAVATAQSQYDTAYAAYQAAKTPANLEALVAAQTALDTALKNLANEPSIPAASKTALAAANAEVASAIADRVKACTAPVTVTPAPTTMTVPPATTTAPTPSSVVPNAIDTGYAL